MSTYGYILGTNALISLPMFCRILINFMLKIKIWTWPSALKAVIIGLAEHFYKIKMCPYLLVLDDGLQGLWSSRLSFEVLSSIFAEGWSRGRDDFAALLFD